MRILQEPKFQPITIILETAQEANQFWDIIEDMGSGDRENLRIKLSNWFSCEAQLGGARE
jgi:hypothetical protein